MSDFERQPSSWERLETEETQRAFREVFASAAGKLVLYAILSDCNVYQSAYAGELTAATNHALGKQTVGHSIINRLDEMDPTAYPELLLHIGTFRQNLKAVAKAAAEIEEGEETDVEA